MKSRPILFSADMVRALLERDKTQTRRVAKLVTSLPEGKGFTCLQKPGTRTLLPCVDGRWQWKPAAGDEYRPYRTIADYCPYGKPGDQLWVRESFACFGSSDSITPPVPRRCQIRYLADRDTEKPADWVPMPADAKEPTVSLRGKPSIHMPRWASRITLEITGVRLERLNDISESDAMDEGCGFLMPQHLYLEGNPDQYRQLYRILWEKINGAGSWACNPWVWVIEFKRL